MIDLIFTFLLKSYGCLLQVSLVGTLENHSSLQFDKGKLCFVWKLFLKRCNNVETANARRIHYTPSCSILDEENNSTRQLNLILLSRRFIRNASLSTPKNSYNLFIRCVPSLFFR